MHYPHRVTFQESVPDVLPSGQRVYSWEDVAESTDLPARIVPKQSDEQKDRFVVDRDLYTVIVQGDREILREMRMTSDFLGTDAGVIEVQRPVLYASPLTYATIVTVERVTAAGLPVQS